MQNFLTFLEITRGNEVVTGGSYYDPWDYTNRNYQQLQNTEPQRVEALYRSLTSDAFLLIVYGFKPFVWNSIQKTEVP